MLALKKFHYAPFALTFTTMLAKLVGKSSTMRSLIIWREMTALHTCKLL